MQNLLKAVTILKNFDVESDPVFKLQWVVKILSTSNIDSTILKDVLAAIDLIEEEENDLAEDYIQRSSEALEKIVRRKKFLEIKMWR